MVTYAPSINAEPIRTDLEHEDWMQSAACQGYEDLFFNEVDESKGQRRKKEVDAKKVCAHCPVLRQCRAWAFTGVELYGVWGGLTENERHKIAGRFRTG